MTDFLNPDEPNFVFNGINALIDFECIIESEIQDVKAQPNIEEITILGRSGTLTEWYGDYSAYDLSIGTVTIPYHRLEEVKRWLSGSGKLITHNDYDKYLEAIPKFSSPLEFENEWGAFYKFELTFRCQPFKRKINEKRLTFKERKNTFFNTGSVNSYPIIEVATNTGNLEVTLNGTTLRLLNLSNAWVIIDCEKGEITQLDNMVRSIGEWPEIIPGQNEISFSDNFIESIVLMRSSWL